MNYNVHRRRLVTWIRSQLIGPATEEEILRGISPADRYPTGVLYPVYKGKEGIDPASEAQEDEDELTVGINSDDLSIDPTSEAHEDEDDQSAVSAIKRRRYVPPSSVGFSFFARGEKIELQVLCSAVRYELQGERDEKGRYIRLDWRRVPLTDSDGVVNMFSVSDCYKTSPSRTRVDVFGGRAGIDVLWRPFADGWITTVSLFNKHEIPAQGDPSELSRIRTENSLFEVELWCVLDAGVVGGYPRVDKSLLTGEEQELELQYKHRKIYAVGHGAAVSWGDKQTPDSEPVKEIWTEFFPEVEVPQVTAEVTDDTGRTLQFLYLASVDETDQLDRFVADYAFWVTEQMSRAGTVEPDEREAADRIVKRMGVTVSRMKRGVSLLRSDDHAMQAFKIANQAMLDQMVQSYQVRGRTQPLECYKWRPFQLAFLLNVIESVVNEDSDFRDTVDLIWFPTGGGKTEAYLGLIAFLIIWRRLTNATSGGGTTVIMRYTLRLLTGQQFLRVTRMICALELIRREKTENLGEPITVGMWVGKDASPNTFKDAKDAVDKATSNSPAPMALVLDHCPWCEDSFKAPDNYIALSERFYFKCKNPDCEFGRSDDVIPCNVVDEALYAEPPTLVIATIDKFAQMAWDERTNAFFGKNNTRPPELVIQDELHLIAGALGSVAGIYEAALDTVLVERGVHPKYIASTATIRMAEQQIQRLYGKTVAVFPPPGLSCEDAYFARTMPLNEKPGRLYIGYLAPMLDRQHCMAQLAAALILAPEVVFMDQENQEELMDAWWTQVVYHGSLKGVQNSHNSFDNDIPDSLQRFSEEIREVTKTESQITSRHTDTSGIAQLTSKLSTEENARTFSRLERSREDPECLDAVLATNMISVGLDVARLALMIINGQPLTTGEYIQASSRIGRGEVPGIVFVNYYRDQARSLSHYENFRPYHESFYRFVEPTSVTPYTYQARVRALHAALVIAVRHSCIHLLANNKAGSFDPSEERVAKVIDTLKRRFHRADQDRAIETGKHLDKLVNEWKTEAEMCKKRKRQLDYSTLIKDEAHNRLLYSHGDKIQGKWATLHTMRTVENTALLKLL